MRIRPVLSNLTHTRPGNCVRERDRNESPPTVAVHESMTGVQKDPGSNMGHAIVRSNWMGATTAPDGGERFSHLRSSGRVPDYGAANRCTHFRRPHLQGAVGRYMNCQVRARLMLRTKLLRCRRNEAKKVTTFQKRMSAHFQPRRRFEAQAKGSSLRAVLFLRFVDSARRGNANR